MNVEFGQPTKGLGRAARAIDTVAVAGRPDASGRSADVRKSDGPVPEGRKMPGPAKIILKYENGSNV